jgi:hypothetical protein
MNQISLRLSFAAIATLLISFPSISFSVTSDSDNLTRLTKAERKMMIQKHPKLNAEVYAKELAQRIIGKNLGSRASIMWLADHPLNEWEQKRLKAKSNIAEIDFSDPAAVRKLQRALNQFERASGLTPELNIGLRAVHAHKRKQKHPYQALTDTIFARNQNVTTHVDDLERALKISHLEGMFKKKTLFRHARITSSTFKAPVDDAKTQIQEAAKMISSSHKSGLHQRRRADFFDGVTRPVITKMTPIVEVISAQILQETPILMKIIEDSHEVMPVKQPVQNNAEEEMTLTPSSSTTSIVSQPAVNEDLSGTEQPSLFSSLLNWWNSKITGILPY